VEFRGGSVVATECKADCGGSSWLESE
jgi:hypothetical protein